MEEGAAPAPAPLDFSIYTDDTLNDLINHLASKASHSFLQLRASLFFYLSKTSGQQRETPD